TALSCGYTCPGGDERGFFFFQAEDGIRDRNVTGVQTCALPISRDRSGGSSPRRRAGDPARRRGELPPLLSRGLWALPRPRADLRSEERRVGKESRDPCTPGSRQANRSKGG